MVECIATVIVDGVPTDYTGAGENDLAAINNIGINLEILKDLYERLDLYSFVMVQEGYQKRPYRFEDLDAQF